ncbi:hypothetical protein [Rhizobium rhizogenes]|uniref:hypothetical protein n=1 Tax=Rhizobium rhizogenes TaxID=359 RepID=UPI00157336CD|nr:hypothetical protein [Rhizobium rhizogenes]NTI78550.1 hypothetical protein [Rhizobium rhizogenes]
MTYNVVHDDALLYQRPLVRDAGAHYQGATIAQSDISWSRSSPEFTVVLRRQDQLVATDLQPEPSGSSLQRWMDLANQTNSVCLGLVCQADAGSSAVSGILADGLAGGAVPGAIAVMGYASSYQEMLERLVDRLRKSTTWTSTSTLPRPDVLAIPFEWPPIGFFVSPQNPLLLECARACHALADSGVPVQLEIIASNGDEEATTPGSGQRDRFFREHLVNYFPKMF